MSTFSRFSSLVVGICLLLGLATLGWFVRDAAVSFKQLDRSVTVKGLSEREYTADVVIWPIQFSAASNDLPDLYNQIETQTRLVYEFLEANGIARDEITRSPPDMSDRSAQRWGDNSQAQFRYVAQQTLTVYSPKVEQIRKLLGDLMALSKRGVVLSNGDTQTRPEYVFTRLNDVKPEMIEEATVKAREVAVKFAEDSGSTLGKIRQAVQGQFSISDRDAGNPHIKQLRVVSTVEYYLSD